MIQKELIRIGTNRFVNESKLDEYNVFNLIFGNYYEFVYVPEHDPYQLVNGTWTGALGYLMNDK